MSRATPSRAAALCLLALLAFGASPSGAERSGRAGVVVSLDGSVSPNRLPRHRSVPVSLTLAGEIHGDHGSPPPRLAGIEIAFGSRGDLFTAGLPTCPRSRLRNATRRQALARCRGALIGRGTIVTEVQLSSGAEPLLAHARALAFNGRSAGRPAVWVHAYSASPPASFVLPFYVRRLRTGSYGVLLSAPVARALGDGARLRSFEVTLGRRYRFEGRERSYLSARCPLPPRFHVGYFPMARATYRFSPAPILNTTILRGCRARD